MANKQRSNHVVLPYDINLVWHPLASLNLTPSLEREPIEVGVYHLHERLPDEFTSLPPKGLESRIITKLEVPAGIEDIYPVMRCFYDSPEILAVVHRRLGLDDPLAPLPCKDVCCRVCAEKPCHKQG